MRDRLSVTCNANPESLARFSLKSWDIYTSKAAGRTTSSKAMSILRSWLPAKPQQRLQCFQVFTSHIRKSVLETLALGAPTLPWAFWCQDTSSAVIYTTVAIFSLLNLQLEGPFPSCTNAIYFAPTSSGVLEAKPSWVCFCLFIITHSTLPLCSPTGLAQLLHSCELQRK